MTTPRRTRSFATVAVLAAAAASAAIGTSSQQARAAASTTVLVLPAPVTKLQTFPGIGLRPDRRLVSHVPADVRTTEDVSVAMDGAGTPAAVVLDEHLHVGGTGAYLIYERGPAARGEPARRLAAARARTGHGRLAGLLPRRPRPGRPAAARPDVGGAAAAGACHAGVAAGRRWSCPPGRTGGAGARPRHSDRSPRQHDRGAARGAERSHRCRAARRTAHDPVRRCAKKCGDTVDGRGAPYRGPWTAAPVAGRRRDAVPRHCRRPDARHRLDQRTRHRRTVLRGPTATAGPDGGRIAGVLAGTADFVLTMPSAGSRRDRPHCDAKPRRARAPAPGRCAHLVGMGARPTEHCFRSYGGSPVGRCCSGCRTRRGALAVRRSGYDRAGDDDVPLHDRAATCAEGSGHAG